MKASLVEYKVESAEAAQEIVAQRLQKEYGGRIKVSFSRTTQVTRVTDNRRFWVVEGVAKERKMLFRKKRWRFTYYIDMEQGKISMMRGRRT